MTSKKFLDFQPLGKHLGRPVLSEEAKTRLTAISNTYEQKGQFQEAKEIAVFLKEFQTVKISQPSIQSADDNEARLNRLQQQIERQKALLLQSQKMETLGVMASGLAHEIMQPLQIILATAQNCRLDVERQKATPNMILEDLDSIASTVKRIDHIVNHLYVLSKEGKPRYESLSVKTVLEDALAMFREQLKNRGIQVKIDTDPNLPPVYVDKVQLEQVVINLINNARDALEGQPDKRITIGASLQNGQIEISFADTGCGIPPEDRDKIFEPFFSTKEKGSGLGLYIVQDIVNRYGGTIHVNSTFGSGTEFVIILPIQHKE